MKINKFFMSWLNEMQKIMMVFIICILLVVIAFFTGCTTRNSPPYTQKETADILRKCYHIDIKPLSEEIENTAPYAHTRYTFQKNPEGYTFTVVAYVSQSGGALIPEQNIKNNYAATMMFYYREQVLALAEKYGLRLYTVDSADDEPVNKVCIYNDERRSSAANLFFDIRDLYNFQSSKGSMNIYDSMNIWAKEPSYQICYLSDGETDPERAYRVYVFFFARGYSKDNDRRTRNSEAILKFLENPAHL